MKNRWHNIYCDEQMDPCPVTEIIEKYQPKHQVKILRFLNLLEEKGPTLPRPYANRLRDGIHELRIRLSGNNTRNKPSYRTPTIATPPGHSTLPPTGTSTT